MATLTNFRTSVAQKIGLNTGDTTELALLDAWINEGVLDILLRTGCKVASTTIALSAGTKDYELSNTILLIKTAYLTSGAEDYPFEQVSEVDIIRLRRSAGTGTTTTARCYAVSGANLLMVYPTPDSAETVTIYYVPRPATLASGTDTPSEIPSEFHKAVEYYALAEAADYDDDKTSNEGDRYRQLYVTELAKMRKYINRKGNLRLGRAIVGRRRVVPSHPSVDVA